MSAKILSGKQLSQQIQLEIKKEVAAFEAAWDVAPKLALVRAGDDPASVSYAGMIERTCAKTDIAFEAHVLPANTSEDEMIRLVRRLNSDPGVHGIILQQPMPETVRAEVVVEVLLHDDLDEVLPVEQLRLHAPETLF